MQRFALKRSQVCLRYHPIVNFLVSWLKNRFHSNLDLTNGQVSYRRHVEVANLILHKLKMAGHRYHGSVVRTILNVGNKNSQSRLLRKTSKFSPQPGIGGHPPSNSNLPDSGFCYRFFYFIEQHFDQLSLQACANILQVLLNELYVVGFLITKKIEKRSLD